jgi:polar amino acid transport system substrate-binding protein
MNRTAILAGLAGLSAAALLAAATAGSADDGKLEQLKAQGFARVAIANEPPYTAVAPDGKVSTSPARSSSASGSPRSSPRSRNTAP